MGAQDISIISIALLAMLIIPLLLFSYTLRLGLTGNIIYATLRMTVQLSFVGIYLRYLFEYNNAAVNVLYLCIMIFVAAFSVVRSSGLRLTTFCTPTIFSIILAQSITLFLFIHITVGKSYLLDAMYLVPVGGMLLGNCLSGNIITLSSFYNNIKKDEKQYLYTLSLGASRFQACLPYIRESMRAGISPTLATMATIGIVSLPGMMTGQLLGGSVPVVAIKYQIAIMIAILVAKFMSSILAVFFSMRTAFTSFDTLTDSIFNS